MLLKLAHFTGFARTRIAAAKWLSVLVISQTIFQDTKIPLNFGSRLVFDAGW